MTTTSVTTFRSSSGASRRVPLLSVVVVGRLLCAAARAACRQWPCASLADKPSPPARTGASSSSSRTRCSRERQGGGKEEEGRRRRDDHLGRSIVVAPAVFEDPPRERPRCNHRMFRSSLYSLFLFGEASRCPRGGLVGAAEPDERLARRERLPGGLVAAFRARASARRASRRKEPLLRELPERERRFCAASRCRLGRAEDIRRSHSLEQDGVAPRCTERERLSLQSSTLCGREPSTSRASERLNDGFPRTTSLRSSPPRVRPLSLGRSRDTD